MFDILHLLIISMAAFIAHGMVIFNDGMHGDGFILNGLLHPSRVDYFRAHSKDSGRRILTNTVAFTSKIENRNLFFHIVGVSCIIIISCITYVICLRCASIDSRVALSVAILVATYTGNQMVMVYQIVFYYLFHALFLVAVLLATFTLESTGWTQGVLCAVSVAMFIVSFQVDSHLAYFYAFVLLFLLKYLCGVGHESALASSAVFVAGMYSVLPIAYWIVNGLFAPRKGLQKKYYQFRFNAEVTLRYALRVLTWGVIGALCEPFRYTLGLRWGWLVLFPATAVAWLFQRLELLAAPPTTVWCAVFILAGLLLLVFGNIPYILVMQPAGLRGWSTKNNLLIGLPTAVLTVGGLGLMLPDRWFSAVLGFSVTFFIGYLLLLNVYWVAIWAKDLSFLRRLERVPGARDCSIFAFRDEHPISMTFDEHSEHYNLALTFMVDWLWGDLNRLVIVQLTPKRFVYNPREIDEAIKITSFDDIFKGLDKDGPQASLVLRPGRRSLSPTEAGLGYLWHRFGPGKGLQAFLDDLTELGFCLLLPYDTQGIQPVNDHGEDTQIVGMSDK